MGNEGFTVKILTNNGPLEHEALTRLHADILTAQPRQFFCHELGANKPDRAAYQRVADAPGNGPARIGLLDDSETNVAGAREAGWQAALYEGHDDAAGFMARLVTDGP